MQSEDKPEWDSYPEWQVIGADDHVTLHTSLHRMGNDNPVVIELINPKNGQVMARTVLKEYIRNHPKFEIVPRKEDLIYITYVPDDTGGSGDGVGITIEPLPWNKINLKPGI
jgi:hypothetical protein